jgi:hypothetical protein
MAPDLMVATYQVHVLGVLNLESQQQADGLQRVSPPVHIVTCSCRLVIVGFGRWK